MHKIKFIPNSYGIKMKSFTALIFLLIWNWSALAQINPENITIVRDQWGIPHIYAKTDAEVAYGLAWATAEDDFNTMQEQMLPIQGLMGQVKGKEGAIFDVAVHIIGANEIVEEKYDTDISPDFKKILEAYAAGANAYAKKHPEEVLHKKLFPVNGKDILKGYVLGMTLMSNVDKSLNSILSGKLQTTQKVESRGSNAFAVSRKKTTDGKTYLAINSHQPLEGLNSWYEAHLCSEEGWNTLGATFAGGVSIFVGSNPNLGWAHTVNYPDLADIYQLTMHPDKKHFYKFDGQWLELEPYHTKARVKLLGFLKIGVKQKFYKSKYGVTFETDQGVFALRFPASRDIRAAEQWYRMNKARNFEEFREALSMRAIICTNIVYADKDDHIYYLSNGRFPIRNPNYDWQGILPGDTSATLWTDNYFPLDSLAQVLDPKSGYVFNANHTPFYSSGPGESPNPEELSETMGYEPPERLTNRGVRLGALLEAQDKMDYETFKKIKFDRTYHKPLKNAPKLEPIFHLDAQKYPKLASSINLLKNWNRVTDEASEAASVFTLVLQHLAKVLKNPKSYREGDELNEAKLIEALTVAQKHLTEHFGSANVPLGNLQRHIRGNVNLPYGGGRDVLAAVACTPHENGQIRARAGDSYIQLVRFSEDGAELECINAYGASAKAGSPHYTDQMELFTKQQLRPMTLDKETIFKEAKKIYHPK